MTLNAKELLSKDSVHWNEFLHLLVYAEIPLRTQAVGIDCIDSLIRLDIFGTWSPIKDSVQKLLSPIIKHLPCVHQLRYPINEDQAAYFIDAFFRVCNNRYLPPLEHYLIPVLLQKDHIEFDCLARRERFRERMNTINREIQEKEVYFFDKNHDLWQGNIWTPYSAHTYISHSQIISYAEKRGLHSKLQKMFSNSAAEELPIIAYKDITTYTQTEGETKYLGLADHLLPLKSRLFTNYADIVASNTPNPAYQTNDQVASKAHLLFQQVNDVRQTQIELREQTLLPTQELTDPLAVDLITAASVAEPTTPFFTTPIQAQGVGAEPVCAKEKNMESNLYPESVQAPPPSTTSMPLLSATLTEPPFRLISLEKLVELTGLSRSTIYNFMNEKHASYDPDFPKPDKLSNKRVVWRQDKITAWIDKKSGQ